MCIRDSSTGSHNTVHSSAGAYRNMNRTLDNFYTRAENSERNELDVYKRQDTGNSYQGLCRMIHDRTHGEDGIYITYEEDNPIAFNPFYTDSGPVSYTHLDVYKRQAVYEVTSRKRERAGKCLVGTGRRIRHYGQHLFCLSG